MVVTELASLPDSFHRDPADRVLVAATRVVGARLLTRGPRNRDRGIVEAQLVETLT